MTTARAAVFVAPHQPMELREYAVPDPEPGAILVKIRLTNICGSDLHQWRGDGGSPIPPGGRVLGHEMVGTVAALGQGVTTDSLGQPLKEGDRITYAYFYPCHRCPACLRGQLAVCLNKLRHYTAADAWPHFGGGYADYYYLHPGHYVFKVPDELPDAVVAPVNCALSQVTYGLRQVDLKLGETVLIQGAGGLGINAVAVAKTMGASQVIVIDGVPERLELARAFGADQTINLQEVLEERARVSLVRRWTGGHGVDVAAELVGIPAVLGEGLKMLSAGGRYLVIGTISRGQTFPFEPSAMVGASRSLVGVVTYDPITIPRALNFLAQNRDRYPFERLVSHRFPLAQIEEAFAAAEWSGRTGDEAPRVTRAAIAPEEG